MFQVTLQITAGIQRKIFISCFRLRQKPAQETVDDNNSENMQEPQKQKKIFRQIIPARELFQRAVQMRCQIRSGRSDHWKEILQKKHRNIRTKILIAYKVWKEDSENTEQDAQDVISVFALADGTYTADGFSFEGGTGKTQISLLKVSL